MKKKANKNPNLTNNPKRPYPNEYEGDVELNKLINY